MKSAYQLLDDATYVDIGNIAEGGCKLGQQRENESIFSVDFMPGTPQEFADSLADDIWNASASK